MVVYMQVRCESVCRATPCTHVYPLSMHYYSAFPWRQGAVRIRAPEAGATAQHGCTAPFLTPLPRDAPSWSVELGRQFLHLDDIYRRKFCCYMWKKATQSFHTRYACVWDKPLVRYSRETVRWKCPRLLRRRRAPKYPVTPHCSALSQPPHASSPCAQVTIAMQLPMLRPAAHRSPLPHSSPVHTARSPVHTACSPASHTRRARA